MPAADEGILHRIRGALLTLHVQLDEILTGDQPSEATLIFESQTVHVVFRSLGPSLLLMAAVSDQMAEAVALTQTFDTAVSALETVVGPLAQGSR